MNKYRNTPQDIHLRIHKFVVSCFKNVVRKIPKTPENIPVISQIASSLTSMGANDQEADAAVTRKDFIAKSCIVKKETKETNFWLRFILDSEILSRNNVEPYIWESQEILLIMSKIILNTRI